MTNTQLLAIKTIQRNYFQINSLLNAVRALTLLLFCAPPLMAAETTDKQLVSDLAEPIVSLDNNNQPIQALMDAFENMGENYKPRTEHFITDGRPKYINRLILERSPYLLQHAHNPVNWYPFGSDAFDLAVAQNKPVFLSIGYATCHWCHVMERESFENEDIAELLNKNFIAIKVDREQLPDVDSLYMSAVLMINGQGGWPMSNFLDSTGRPFHGATYIPPDAFINILKQIETLWRDDKQVLLDAAGDVSEALDRANRLSHAARDVGENEVARARAMALARHDDNKGGFSQAPKFPQEALLTFLLNEARLKKHTPSFNAVNFTLEKMAAGGIHDQIGGGFHRYAVDNEWLVPHFEKMLYNQGLLSRVYSQAYSMSGDSQHEYTAKGIFDYVAREMRSPEGLFYSATDADSEGAEGTFFLWSPETIKSVVGEEDAAIAEALWGVTPEGNFEHQSILYLPKELDSVAQSVGLSVDALLAKRAEIGQKLLTERDTRIRPLRDDKIITAWNALMITAFAEGGQALNEPRYTEIALNAGTSLWQKMRVGEGMLWRTLYEEQASVPAKQTDYAYLAESLIALYDISGDILWLNRARDIVEEMNERFWDTDEGGYFLGEASVSGTALTVRPKDLHDSSMPSGNSVALRTIAKLYKRTGEERYADRANELIATFSSFLAEQPGGFYYMLTGVSEHLSGEAGPLDYAARGVVKVSAERRDSTTVDIHIAMKVGWHLNSNTPIQDYLVPITVSSEQPSSLSDIQFPEPVLRKLGFERSELSLFEGQVSISATVNEDDIAESVLPLYVRLQACDDEVCLAPETVSIDVSWN